VSSGSSRDQTPQAARTLRVDAHAGGQRIDNFLMKTLIKVPKSRVYRLLRTGQVRVNGGRKKPHYRLQQGDEVRIPPLVDAEKRVARIPEAVIARVTRDVIYEDDAVIVLNKQPGLAVHGGSGLVFGLIEALRQARGCKTLELAHRLDRDTSGCLLVAKHRPALVPLQQAFRDHRVEKTYLALTAGRWTQTECTVRKPLRKNQLQSGERMVHIDETGKPAVSHFRVVEQFEGAALVSVRIETGRTHQIRVHAASLGHPIVGDEKYGDRQLNQQLRQAGCKRLYLHAEHLVLLDQAAYRFHAPPDQQWQADMVRLRPSSL